MRDVTSEKKRAMNSIRQFANTHADVIAVAVLIAAVLLQPQVATFRNATQGPLWGIRPMLESIVAGASESGDDMGFRLPICPELSPFTMANDMEARRRPAIRVRQISFRFE